jgi:two-component system sensor histidine kinase KdpD
MAVALLGAPVLTVALLPVRGSVGLDTILLIFVLVSVTASVLGGLAPALTAALVSFGVANFFFAPPYGTLVVASAGELVDLVVFFAVTALVGVITEVGARTRERAERARTRAEWLAGLEDASDPTSLAAVLAEARRVYGAEWAALTERDTPVATAGRRPPNGQDLRADAGDGLSLMLVGPEHIGADLAPLQALAATAGRLWRSQRLAEQADRAEELARIDELRASLLAAVGHDIRAPLAAIRTSADTLNDPTLALSADDRQELLDQIQASVGRLDGIIANLLDLSRLQVGALSVGLEPVSILQVLSDAVRRGTARVRLEIPDDLPQVVADPGLLERVMANLVDNADRYEPSGGQIVIAAYGRRGRVEISVIDHGPGVSSDRLAEIFRPFQHFSDRAVGGVGLGLAISRGFVEAMGGTLAPSATPGGGLTMTVSLEVSDATNPHR